MISFWVKKLCPFQTGLQVMNKWLMIDISSFAVKVGLDFIALCYIWNDDRFQRWKSLLLLVWILAVLFLPNIQNHNHMPMDLPMSSFLSIQYIRLSIWQNKSVAVWISCFLDLWVSGTWSPLDQWRAIMLVYIKLKLTSVSKQI